MRSEQINIEYFFRLLYDLFAGTHTPGLDYTTLTALAANLWFWIVLVSYLVSIVGLFIVAYAMLRLYDVRKREEAYYSTLIAAPVTAGVNPRWVRIEELAGGTSSSEWREAIL